MTLTIEEASTQLAQLIEKAASGEEIIIARDSATAIRLTPFETPSSAPRPPRVPGMDKGQIWMAPDFDVTDEDIINDFYDGEIYPCQSLKP